MKIDISTIRLALALACAYWLAGSGIARAANDIQISTKQAQALGIETTPLAAQSGSTGSGLPAQVTIPPAQVRIVSAPVAGLLESIAVATNQPVRRGQALAHMQSTGLIELQREYLQTATQMHLARETLSRDEKLFKEGIIAESRYLAAKGNATAASAAFSERRQALRLAGMSDAAIEKLRASHAINSVLEIVSPLDGVVLEQMAALGQRAEAATPLFKIANLTPLWLEIQVPISQAAALRPGAAVDIPAYQARGKILSVGRSVLDANQTVPVRAEIRENAENMRPGQFVEVLITTATGNDKQWLVPNSALIRHQGQAHVFVQTAKGFRAQPVRLVSEMTSSSIIASAGLRGDERVVVRGAAALKAAWQGVGEGE